MMILGFNYDNVVESQLPMTFDFNKEQETVSAYYVDTLGIFVVREEIILHVGTNALFAYQDGVVAGIIEEIDYDKQRIKVGKFYISEKDSIYLIGMQSPDLNQQSEEEFEAEDDITDENNSQD